MYLVKKSERARKKKNKEKDLFVCCFFLSVHGVSLALARNVTLPVR